MLWLFSFRPLSILTKFFQKRKRIMEFHRDRRQFLKICSAVGVTSAFFAGALSALASAGPKEQGITADMIDEAAQLADIPISNEQKDQLLKKLNEQRDLIGQVRRLPLKNNVAPALIFVPLVDRPISGALSRTPAKISDSTAKIAVPSSHDKLAFATVRELSELIQTQKISALALTEMYLERLKQSDARLHCVIALLEDRARTQAKAADAEIAQGHYRGPLHGIPWGAKDLLSVAGYRTTWGAGGFQDQTLDTTATVVRRLDEAGAVLIAKLTLGALAMGDKWFGGRTRNPWILAQGSSGSSAGSAAATAAGCVAFAVGSETLGSISSPSSRCGVTGYRPTFGYVPRTGAMALSWSMDKLGPIARSAEDCALVMQAVYGPDGSDRSVREVPFAWDSASDWKKLRIGFVEEEFTSKAKTVPPINPQSPDASEKAAGAARRDYDRRYDQAALETLRKHRVDLIPITLPSYPLEALALLLNAEAAAAFDDLTLSGRDKLLTEQGPDDWPNLFRAARFYSAVEYVQANRARTLLMHDMNRVFQQVDLIVTPTTDPQLMITNLTGHPAVIVPNGLRGADAPAPPVTDNGEDDRVGGPGTPVSLTFLGNLYEDSKLLAFAHAYQQMTDFHRRHPPLFKV